MSTPPKVDFYYFHKQTVLPMIKEFSLAHGLNVRWDKKADKLSQLRRQLENAIIEAFPEETDHGVTLAVNDKKQLVVEFPQWYRTRLRKMAEANYSPMEDGRFVERHRFGNPLQPKS